jgi:copper(I)-binding protein
MTKVEIFRRRTLAAIPVTALALLAGLCGARAAAITVTGGWFRALPAALPSGGYFTVHNGGDTPQTLTGAQSPACGALMLHKSMNHGGMATMEHVNGVAIAPGGTLTFAPGGYHLMCMDSKPILKPGARVAVTLHFADGGKVTGTFAVRNAAGK